MLSPKVLFVEVVLFFQKSTKGTIAELLNALDEDSGSLIGSLLSEQLNLEEKNSLKYFQDCLSEIKKSIERINKLKLSKFSENLFFQVLFTNAYPPEKNLNADKFLDIKINWLIKNERVNDFM